VSFSPDGRKLASAGGEVLFRDLTGNALKGHAQGASEVDALWKDLGGSDAVQANQAIWRLNHPAQIGS